MRLSVLQRCGIVASAVYAIGSVGLAVEPIRIAAIDHGLSVTQDCLVHSARANPSAPPPPACFREGDEAGPAEQRRLWLAAARRIAIAIGLAWIMGFLVLQIVRWIAAGRASSDLPNER